MNFVSVSLDDLYDDYQVPEKKEIKINRELFQRVSLIKEDLRVLRAARKNWLLLTESIDGNQNIYMAKRAKEEVKRNLESASYQFDVIAKILKADLQKKVEECKEINLLEKEVIHCCVVASKIVPIECKDDETYSINGKVSKFTLRAIRKVFYRFTRLL